MDELSQAGFSASISCFVDWPIDMIEFVESCPVCSGKESRVLYTGLRDLTLFCAPGIWVLRECTACKSAYLGPRPTPASMHLAYQNYHTHSESVRLPAESLRGVRWLQRVLANGYKNWQFGTNLQPSSWAGIPVAFLLPTLRAVLNRQYRHLPTLPEGGRLLDVGFGDGSFLANVQAIGWDAVGLDFDADVVKNARQRGLKVHEGSVEEFTGEDDSFDVITMCHVIEHLYDPVASLKACHRLLKPGGLIWIETPNISSLGRIRFKQYWRGLEPPRHLVLFNKESLASALHGAGFEAVKDLPQPSPCYGVYAMSQRMSEGLDPYSDAPIKLKLRLEILLTRLIEVFWRSRREFLGVTATKALGGSSRKAVR